MLHPAKARTVAETSSDQLLGHVDVRGFDVALVEHPRAVTPGRVGCRRAARGGLEEEVFADRLQAADVNESRQLQGTDLSRRARSRLRHADHTVLGDGHRQGVGRDRHARLNRVTARSHELALIVFLEGSVAGVSRRSVGQQHLEETGTVDTDVEVVAGLLQAPLSVDTHHRHRPHPTAELQAARNLRLLRGLGAGLAQGLVEQVFEHRARTLEAVGADVGQIVRNHVEARLLRIEPGTGHPKGTDHFIEVLSLIVIGSSKAIASPAQRWRRPSAAS